MIAGWKDWYLPWVQPFGRESKMREFFIGGCNLRCVYCKRKWIVDSSSWIAQEGIDDVVKEAAEMELGVYVSGGDPIMDPESTLYLLRRGHELGTWTGFSSNGTAPHLIELFAKESDYAKIDIKGSTRYAKQIAGVPNYNIDVVLDSIERIRTEILAITLPIFSITKERDVAEIIERLESLTLRAKNTIILLREYHPVPWAPDWLKQPEKQKMEKFAQMFLEALSLPVGIRAGDGGSTRFTVIFPK